MKIKVKFFAFLKEISGSEFIKLEIKNGATLGDLKRMLKERYGSSLNLERGIVFAVNGTVVKKNVKLKEGDEIALLPPVSGGQND